MKKIKNMPRTKVGMMMDPSGNTMLEDNLPRSGPKQKKGAMKPGSGPQRPRPQMNPIDLDNDND